MSLGLLGEGCGSGQVASQRLVCRRNIHNKGCEYENGENILPQRLIISICVDKLFS